MPDDVDLIKRLEVTLVVRICETRMNVREVLAMTPGSIIELPTSAEGKLEILVGGKPIGTGKAVKIGENFGVSVHQIGEMIAEERETDDFGDDGDFDPEAFADALLAAQG